MGQPALEVADIFRTHGPAWRQAQRGHLSLGQLKVMSAIEQCRSAALGGHVLRCEGCGADQIAYNSCRNRHCPKCQSSAAKRWLEARQADLLPVEYYHVVFTLPAPIADIAYQNKAVVYGLLFDVAAETLLTIAADPKHLGAQHRRDAGAAHLGLGADASPARARHRARRRAGARRRALGRLQAGVLPVRCGCCRGCSGGASSKSSRRRIAAGGCSSSASTPRWPMRSAFARWLAPLRTVRVGRLCQAAVRRTRGGAGLPVALHAPGGHLQQPAARHGRARRHLPLEGLPGQGTHAPQDHDARRRASSCAASCCTCCPAASIASATTGCWPTAAARPAWRSRASCCTSLRAARHSTTAPTDQASTPAVLRLPALRRRDAHPSDLHARPDDPRAAAAVTRHEPIPAQCSTRLPALHQHALGRATLRLALCAPLSRPHRTSPLLFISAHATPHRQPASPHVHRRPHPHGRAQIAIAPAPSSTHRGMSRGFLP